jgi:hypothetical protein
MTCQDRGLILVKPEAEFCNYEALRNYYPWAFCEICRKWVRQNLMHDEDSCELCHSEKEVESTDNHQSRGTGRKLEGPGVEPLQMNRKGNGEIARPRRVAGQLSLGI